jgi:glycosyltransferase 2 family protein
MVWGKFLPATIGADAVRAFSTSRTGLAANEVVASIVVERMIGFIAGLLLGLLSFSLLLRLGVLDARFNLVWWLWSLSVFATVLVFATSLSQTAFDFIHGRLLRGLASARITQRLRKLHLTYLAYLDEKGCLALFFGLTLVEQFIPILQAWVIALTLGVEVSFLYIAVAVPPALLIAHIPISIDGLGVFEGAFMLLIALGGDSPSGDRDYADGAHPGILVVAAVVDSTRPRGWESSPTSNRRRERLIVPSRLTNAVTASGLRSSQVLVVENRRPFP